MTQNEYVIQIIEGSGLPAEYTAPTFERACEIAKAHLARDPRIGVQMYNSRACDVCHVGLTEEERDTVTELNWVNGTLA